MSALLPINRDPALSRMVELNISWAISLACDFLNEHPSCRTWNDEIIIASQEGLVEAAARFRGDLDIKRFRGYAKQVIKSYIIKCIRWFMNWFDPIPDASSGYDPNVKKIPIPDHPPEAKSIIKINRRIARSIRERVAAGETRKEVAKELGLSKNSVDLIVNEKRWSESNKNHIKVDFEMAKSIKDRLAKGERGCDIAAELGLSKETVSAIKNGRRWRNA